MGARVTSKCEKEEIEGKLSKSNTGVGAVNHSPRSTAVQECIVQNLQKYTKINSAVWLQFLGAEYEKLQTLTIREDKVGKKDIPDKKTESGYVRKINAEVYSSYSEREIDTVVRSRRLKLSGHSQFGAGV